MKSHYRAVVIGGGVVGASVLYHLAKYGWSDVALMERSVLTAGSSWHAAGRLSRSQRQPQHGGASGLHHRPAREVETESGQSIGMHMTGGIHVASAPERWEWLQSSYRRFQAIGIEDVRLVTPEEIKARCPVISVEGVLGGMWADREGYLDTTGTVWAYAGAAKKRGAKVIEHNRVLEFKQRRRLVWDLVTEQGTVNAEHVVNAGGLWAKQVGRMVGLDLPLSPMEHHYLLTEAIPEIAALKTRAADGRRSGGLHLHAPGSEGHAGRHLRDAPPALVDGRRALGLRRRAVAGEHRPHRRRTRACSPALSRACRRRACANGSTAPSPSRPTAIRWSVRSRASRLLAGLRRHGGISARRRRRQVARRMDDPRRGADDVLGLDIARYGAFASNREYIKQTTGQFYARRFVMTYPNEQLPAGRPLKMSPSYAAMTAAGCRWGNSWGLEIPLYFAPEGFEENPTLKRSNAFDIVGAECRRCGKRRPARYLGVLALRGDRPRGRELARLAAGLAPAQARPRAPCADAVPDRTAQRRPHGDQLGRWDILDRGLLLPSPMAYALVRPPCSDGVQVRDISDDVIGFSLSGPKSRDLLARLTHQDVSNAALPFMGAATRTLACAREGRAPVGDRRTRL